MPLKRLISQVNSNNIEYSVKKLNYINSSPRVTYISIKPPSIVDEDVKISNISGTKYCFALGE